RASISPATFAHAISRMIPTASISTYRGLEYSLRAPVRPVCAGNRVTCGLSAAVESVFGPASGPAPGGAARMTGVLPAGWGIGAPAASLGTETAPPGA